MAQFASDTFTGTEGAELSAYSSSWDWPAYTAYQNNSEIASNRCRGSYSASTVGSIYVHSGIPASANYSVEADLYFVENNGGIFYSGIVGRFDETESASIPDQFRARWVGGGTNKWELSSAVGGTLAVISQTTARTVSAGTTKTLRLEMDGDGVRAYVDDVLELDEPDTTPSGVGKAGVYHIARSTSSDSTGVHIDNFSADDLGGGATVNLDGAASAVVSASGALSVSVPLAGAGLSVTTASGALSISIPLAGSAVAQADASGTLSTTGTADLAGQATATASASGGLSLSIPLAGSAVAHALASAALSLGVPLDGSASGTASASADMSVAKPLDGSATGQASASGALSINVTLSGAAIAEAAASAGLTVTSASSLAGTAQAEASASAALSLAIPLSGAALTVSSADGSLTHIVPLAGSAAAASLATGGLDVSVNLSGAALAEALASAGLSVEQAGLTGAAAGEATASGVVTLRINLEGAAVAHAIAAGALTAQGLILAASRGYIVERNQRAWQVARAPRTYKVSA